MKQRLIPLLLLMLVSASFPAVADRAVWDKTPIKVVLLPGNERIISFPAKSVRAKIPAAIRGDIDVLSNNGVLYLTAKKEFIGHQVLVQDKQTGRIIILSLSSSKDLGSMEELSILLSESKENAGSSEVASNGSFDTKLGYEDLIRMAAKHIYAPARLVSIPANTQRVQLKRIHNSRLVRGSIIFARPEISFNHEGLYVTAVILTNQESTKIVLDPRELRGDWLAASFQHVVLGPKGSDTDTTSLYLVSKRPFWEAL